MIVELYYVNEIHKYPFSSVKKKQVLAFSKINEMLNLNSWQFAKPNNGVLELIY